MNTEAFVEILGMEMKNLNDRLVSALKLPDTERDIEIAKVHEQMKAINKTLDIECPESRVK